jgi:hypothetical protein
MTPKKAPQRSKKAPLRSKKAPQRYRYSIMIGDAARAGRTYEGWFYCAADAMVDAIRADERYGWRGIGTTVTVACTCREEWTRRRKTSGLRRTA